MSLLLTFTNIKPIYQSQSKNAKHFLCIITKIIYTILENVNTYMRVYNVILHIIFMIIHTTL